MFVDLSCIFPPVCSGRLKQKQNNCSWNWPKSEFCSQKIYTQKPIKQVRCAAAIPPQLLNCIVGIFTSLSLTIQFHWLTGISNIMREENKSFSLFAFSRSCIILCTYVLFPLSFLFQGKNPEML